MSRVVVIGAGLAGLAAACHLLGAGHQVTLLEREELPGGRCGRLQRDGFSFDTGPTVLTMPELLDDALAAIGQSREQLLPLRRLDPAYRARYADGSELRVRAGTEAMRAEIARVCGERDAAAYEDFVDWLETLYRLELPHFIDRNFDTPLDLLTRPRALAGLLRAGGFGRLGAAIERRFADERLHRLFSFQAMYAGLSPTEALAIYAVITYMDSVSGVYFPEPGPHGSGMHAVPAALAAAAETAGAEIGYGQTVRQILRRGDGAVAGVELGDGSRIAADAVVCTLDLPQAYATVLKDLPMPLALRRPKFSPSAVVWHLGVRGGPPPDASHHNIHFGEAWGPAFDDLLDHGRLMRSASRLVCIPSIDDPAAAPEGASSIYLLEPVPNLVTGRIDWQRERPAMQQRLLEFLAANGYPTDIVTEEMVTPLDWAADGMAAGTPFALSHNFAQTGPFRPANTTRRLPGLVFAGSGTVPGVGVPMVLISGKLAAERVTEYLR